MRSRQSLTVIVVPLGVLAVGLCACTVDKKTADEAQTTKPMVSQIIPKPQRVQQRAGGLVLTGRETVRADNPDFRPLAADIEERLSANAVAEDTTSPAVIELRTDTALASEAYTLEIAERSVTITAATPAGMFYGAQTLRQLLYQTAGEAGGFALPLLSVEDAPAFTYRGMHLDVSRHFFDVEFVKKYIDLIALHKMNHFHWHLTDDQGWRIEIEKYPRLTTIGASRTSTVVGHTANANAVTDGVVHEGHYTKADIREVVRYAADRHITVVPEIDVPGHASALLAAYPEFGCGPRPEVKTHFGIFKHVLCPTEATFAFLDDVLREVAALFPGPFIHIGGDEVVKDHWRDCVSCRALMQREGLADLDALQAYFVNRTEELVRAYGKRIIGWDEILDDGVNRSASIMSWRGMAAGLHASSLGQDVIMTPLEHVYFDFYQSTSLDEPLAIHGLTRLTDVYRFDPAPITLNEAERQRILGAQANLWTEYVPDEATAERMVLPRMSALAEILWSPRGHRSFPDFVARLETFIPYLEDQGYRVARSHYKPEIRAQLTNDGRAFLVELDNAYGAMYYSLDGSMPDRDSDRYLQPFRLNRSATIRARTLHPSGEWHGDSRLTVELHKAAGLAVSAPGGSDSGLTSDAGRILTDGVLATDRIFHYDEWFGYAGKRFDAVIEFPRPTTVQSVTIGVDAGRHRKLHRPSRVAVFAAKPNGEWAEIGALDGEAIAAGDGRLRIETDPVTITELRVEIANDRQAWSAERESRQAVAVSIDEITVH